MALQDAPRYDALIVGGGIIGQLTARELARAGLSTALLDRGPLGREASWAGGGILSPLYPWRYPAAVWQLARLSQNLYAELDLILRDSGAGDAELERTGLLVLDAEECDAGQRWAVAHGVEARRLNTAELRQLEPAVAADEGLLLMAAGHIRNPRLLKALKVDLARAGVALVEGVEARGLLREGDQVVGIESTRGPVTAGAVVISAGAWSGELGPRLGLDLPVRPVKGQMLLTQTRPGLLGRVVMHKGRYLIPRRDGHVVIGSTMEEAGFDRSTTDMAQDTLWRAALEMVPALADHQVVTRWAGFRPGSPTGVPFIGPHPTLRGLYVNTGHFRNGICMAPASARLLADLMLGRPPCVDPAPYAWPALPALPV